MWQPHRIQPIRTESRSFKELFIRAVVKHATIALAKSSCASRRLPSSFHRLVAMVEPSCVVCTRLRYSWDLVVFIDLQMAPSRHNRSSIDLIEANINGGPASHWKERVCVLWRVALRDLPAENQANQSMQLIATNLNTIRSARLRNYCTNNGYDVVQDTTLSAT